MNGLYHAISNQSLFRFSDGRASGRLHGSILCRPFDGHCAAGESLLTNIGNDQ
jgi:hypothetical protein